MNILVFSEGKMYKVSPWSLIWQDERYYLAGYDETSESEGWISILYITSLEYTKNKPEGIELTTRFNYDEVEHMIVKRVK